MATTPEELAQPNYYEQGNKILSDFLEINLSPFHIDWNLLMQVVAKIEGEAPNTVEMCANTCIIRAKTRIKCVEPELGKQHAVWRACLIYVGRQ